jgi:hypothetical protein
MSGLNLCSADPGVVGGARRPQGARGYLNPTGQMLGDAGQPRGAWGCLNQEGSGGAWGC